MSHVGLLGAVPYVVAFMAMQVNGWHSDKRRERRWHSAIPLFIAAAGLPGLISQPHSISLSLVFFTMVCMVFAYLPAFWAIPTEILSQSGRSGRRGNDQRRWQHCRFCRPLPVRLPEHSNRILFDRSRPDDGLRPRRSPADPAYSPNCAGNKQLLARRSQPALSLSPAPTP